MVSEDGRAPDGTVLHPLQVQDRQYVTEERSVRVHYAGELDLAILRDLVDRTAHLPAGATVAIAVPSGECVTEVTVKHIVTRYPTPDRLTSSGPIEPLDGAKIARPFEGDAQ